MSKKSEKQFEVIIEKLDQLLEENKQLKTTIAQKDDELSLQKEQIEFLTQKLYGPIARQWPGYGSWLFVPTG